MLRILITVFCIAIHYQAVFAQVSLNLKDSITVSVVQRYDSVSNLHRKVFGENYRKEWAAKTRLPIIKLSEIRGGLVATELGGGHQSRSLRLEESSGKEWVLRSVAKYSEGLAPDLIKGSLYENWLDDNFSAQHPYSALIVPVLAEAVKVPHTNPVIGWVAADKGLGKYAAEFTGLICLLEEREPEGESDNTIKMLGKLEEDNDNRLDSAVFLRARMLDLLIADWGRHEDQWRWADTQKGEGKNYLVVPRDRDQALYVNEGILPGMAAGVSLLAFLEGFNSTYTDPNAFFINGRNLNQQFLNQYSYEDWMQTARDFVAAMSDEVLSKAVARLPVSSVNLQGEIILTKLKGRRDNLVSAMDTYYRFLYNIIDIRTSDKNELVNFTGLPDGAIELTIHKISKSGKTEQLLFNHIFKPEFTREIRLFLGEGDDSVRINAPESLIKVRLVGDKGYKKYELEQSATKVHVYDADDKKEYFDPGKKLVKHISADTLNVRKVFTNQYLGSGITPTVDIRSIDGISPGLSYKIEKEGFRSDPYGSLQTISAYKSLATKSFVFQYEGIWKDVFRNTDLIVNSIADVKGNILNFFGRGNDTEFNQTGEFRRFYRVNFSLYEFNPALKFSFGENGTLTAGPVFQYFVNGNNGGRYFNTAGVSSQYKALYADKMHGGILVNYNLDKRDHKLFASKGINFDISLKGLEGLNSQSHGFAQVFTQFSIYSSIDPKGKLVIANRTGGALTSGTTAFYQSAFLGSHDNLLGFRKNRFAGDNLVYNNLEARFTLPNFLHYILPGKIGLIGFYDVGRVWVKNENSKTIHRGLGGGLFLTPFNRLFIRAVAGYSVEGVQPTITLKQRF